MGSSGIPDLTFRAAEATETDAAAFARLLDQAQDGWYRIALGSSASRVIASAFVTENHELSYENVTIADRDGLPVGMVSAYSARTHSQFGPDPVADMARGRLRYRATARLSRRTLSFLAQIPDGDYYVRAIAVDPDHRGHGIGTLLLDAVSAAARVAGCRRIALDVAASNRAGRRLYQRYGMTQEAASPRFLGLPNTHVLRMVKDV